MKQRNKDHRWWSKPRLPTMRGPHNKKKHWLTNFVMENVVKIYMAPKNYLWEQDNSIEELLERNSSISVSVDNVEHFEDKNVSVAHAQRRRKLFLRERRSHHHDNVACYVFQLKIRLIVLVMEKLSTRHCCEKKILRVKVNKRGEYL